MNRHDLVFVDPLCTPDLSLLSQSPDPETVRALARWIRKGLPLVFPRQNPDPEMVRLAVRLPPTQCNARIAPAFPLSAVTRIQPPLSLHTCIDRLSESAQNTLKDLDQASTTLGVSLKTYGSLAWEILSGEPYRHASSDLDLLAEIEDFTQLPGILQALENAASHLSFKLDGEVRFHETHAVAWRELAQRLERPTSTVLVKTNRTVFLQTVGSLLQTLKGHS